VYIIIINAQENNNKKREIKTKKGIRDIQKKSRF
jgi:hypothetical protein